MDRWIGRRGGEGESNRLNMSETISTSVSAAAIFSAEESWGRLPKRKDIVVLVVVVGVEGWGLVGCMGIVAMGRFSWVLDKLVI